MISMLHSQELSYSRLQAPTGWWPNKEQVCICFLLEPLSMCRPVLHSVKALSEILAFDAAQQAAT